MYTYDSQVFFRGHSTFINNSVTQEGGAIYADYMTKFEFIGTNSFKQNSATFNGGGMYITYYSEAFFKGHTAFVNNLGGGIDAADSSCHFEGYTAFTGNEATYGGGLELSWSTALFLGNVVFLDNKARTGGGAISLFVSSILHVNGTGNFTKNTARYDGGVIYSATTYSPRDHRIVLDGKITMAKNSAGSEGGAISVSDTALRISGNAVFEENFGNVGGGALHVSSSDFEFSGVSRFVSNMANASLGTWGGAIATEWSDITLTGTHIFINNTAGSGGGIALGYCLLKCDPLYITQNTSVIFLDNYARDFGGAIFVEDGLDNNHNCLRNLDILERACFVRFDSKSHTYNPLSHVRLPDYYINHFHECIGSTVLFEGNFAGGGGNAIYGDVELCSNAELR